MRHPNHAIATEVRYSCVSVPARKFNSMIAECDLISDRSFNQKMLNRMPCQIGFFWRSSRAFHSQNHVGAEPLAQVESGEESSASVHARMRRIP